MTLRHNLKFISVFVTKTTYIVSLELEVRMCTFYIPNRSTASQYKRQHLSELSGISPCCKSKYSLMSFLFILMDEFATDRNIPDSVN